MDDSKNRRLPSSTTLKMETNNSKKDILIGGKPFMSYVMRIVGSFNKDNIKEVIIKSRGKFISKAVDVAEVIKKKFSNDNKIQVEDIKIGSEEFQNKEQKNVCVSTLEIKIRKED